MTKYEFMNELEQLLFDISLEERTEALKYYSDYFEDAGPDREQAIISELGTPVSVAAGIKADLTASEQEVKNRGYFTENGYEDENFNEPKYELINGKTVKVDNNNSKETIDTDYNTNTQNNGYGTDSQNEDYGYANTQNRQHNRTYNNSEDVGYNDSPDGKGNRNGLRVILIILLCIFAIPVGIPIIAVIFSLFLAAAITAAALWLTFVIVSAVLIITGIGVTVYGIFRLITFPALGFCFTGGGLILFGIGLVFAMVTILLSSKIMPLIIRGFINFCRLPFQNRRVPA